MFRTLTLAGLVAGLPLTLFIFTFNGFRAVMDQMLTPGGSDAAAAICCAICGMALLAPVYQGHRAAERFTGPINAHTPELPIDGTDTRYTRIAALRRACEDGTGITVIAESRMHSADIAERYWLARSLACSHQPESRGLIRQLAADPSPIVACQALRAMGAQGNRTWIPYLVDRIQNDPHGYVQIYAYRALRTLGWVQPLPLTHDF